MALARSSAPRSETSSTTISAPAARRTSLQMVQGSTVSTLPQQEQTRTFSSASPMARLRGANSCSFFLIRCKAARRAERGPSPGTLARSWISRSISGPAIRLDMEPSHAVRKGTGGLKAALLNQEIGSCQSERQLETGGNRQSCRHLLGLALHLGFD